MSSFKPSLFPTVKAQDEEDLIDPQQVARDKCKEIPKAVALFEKLQTCNNRVNSRTNTAETCLEEILDYVHVVDECAAKMFFNKLK